MGFIMMKHKKIAVFSNGWSNEYIEKVLEGIRRGAAEDGVDIFFFATYIYSFDEIGQNKCQLNIFHLPDPNEFDGAIMFTNTFNLHDEQERICALFQRAGIPMISTEIEVPGMAYLGTENYGGVHELATHLIEVHGVKKITFMAGIEGNEESDIRQHALEDALAEHGLKLYSRLQGDYGFYTSNELIKKMLDEGQELPEAFVCANDHMALGISAALHDRGYRVPEDVIVTGFDKISEASSSFPLLATVSRGWESLGDKAYKELKNQIENPNPEYYEKFDSYFVPSESCGCAPTKEALEDRLEVVRNNYANVVSSNMLEIFFHKFRIEAADVESKEEFFEVAKRSFEVMNLVGKDFAICTEPAFFEIEDKEYPKRIRGYSSKMDVIYAMKNGKPVPQYMFNSSEIVPGYRKRTGESNLYTIVPLNNMEYIIGYLVIANDTKLLYDCSLRRFVYNMNSLFITIRQYIFAQKTNRKLLEIYRTDFLTGMYNRTGCDEVIYSYISEQRKNGYRLLLLFADIDRMKIINDRYGHLNGDLAIKATADALKKCLPGDWLFGRYGGDEFIAVGLCLNEDEVENRRENLWKSMNGYIEGLHLSFDLSASVGCAVINPDDEGSISDYIREADESMYEEKKKAHERIEKKLAQKDNKQD